MNKELNIDAIVTWMYVVECIDQRLMLSFDKPKLDSAFMRLMSDLIAAYPTECDAVLAVRDAYRLMRVKHD